MFEEMDDQLILENVAMHYRDYDGEGTDDGEDNNHGDRISRGDCLKKHNGRCTRGCTKMLVLSAII